VCRKVLRRKVLRHVAITAFLRRIRTPWRASSILLVLLAALHLCSPSPDLRRQWPSACVCSDAAGRPSLWRAVVQRSPVGNPRDPRIAAATSDAFTFTAAAWTSRVVRHCSGRPPPGAAALLRVLQSTRPASSRPASSRPSSRPAAALANDGADASLELRTPVGFLWRPRLAQRRWQRHGISTMWAPSSHQGARSPATTPLEATYGSETWQRCRGGEGRAAVSAAA